MGGVFHKSQKIRNCLSLALQNSAFFSRRRCGRHDGRGAAADLAAAAAVEANSYAEAEQDELEADEGSEVSASVPHPTPTPDVEMQNNNGDERGDNRVSVSALHVAIRCCCRRHRLLQVEIVPGRSIMLRSIMKFCAQSAPALVIVALPVYQRCFRRCH